jgi:hypothetical protein
VLLRRDSSTKACRVTVITIDGSANALEQEHLAVVFVCRVDQVSAVNPPELSCPCRSVEFGGPIPRARVGDPPVPILPTSTDKIIYRLEQDR